MQLINPNSHAPDHAEVKVRFEISRSAPGFPKARRKEDPTRQTPLKESRRLPNRSLSVRILDFLASARTSAAAQKSWGAGFPTGAPMSGGPRLTLFPHVHVVRRGLTWQARRPASQQGPVRRRPLPQSRNATCRIAAACVSVFISTRCQPFSSIVAWSA